MVDLRSSGRIFKQVKRSGGCTYGPAQSHDLLTHAEMFSCI